jgi:dipeptidyl aminopeptidase/acylaminoacyl peptidase
MTLSLLFAACALPCAISAPQQPSSETRPPASAAATRGMKPDDLFTLSELDDVTVSPDGEWIAATITRPGTANACPTCNYKATGDVWLIHSRTGERRNLTNGAQDGSSSWFPTWSPDGRRLAFVSTRSERGEHGASNKRLHNRDSSSGTLHRESGRGVYLQVDFQLPAQSPRAIMWLNATTLLAALLPEGVSAEEQILYWRRGVADATRAWARWQAGTEPTASILESGGAAAPLPTVSLERIDAERHTTRSVADVPRWDLWDLQLGIQVGISPDLRLAAVLAIAGTMQMGPDISITDAIRTYRVGVASLAGAEPIRWAALDGSKEHVDGRLLGWASDSAAFALAEQATPRQAGSRRIALVVSAGEGSVRDVTPPAMTVDEAVWTADGHLVVRARRESDTSPRWDWWRLGEGAPRNVTAAMPKAPSRLLPAGAADRFLGLADGTIWTIGVGRESFVEATPANQFGRGTLTLLPPGPDGKRADLLFEGAVLAHVTLPDPENASTLAVHAIAPPTPTARLLDGDPGTGTLVFRDDTPGGTVLWATDGRGGNAQRRLTVNEHVASIAEGRRLLIQYRGADGNALQGLAILPPGYEAGQRHAVAVWVYGGLVVRDAATALASKTSTRPLNLELLAGHGYVVLIPSVPLPSPGGRGDPLIDISKGVMPCVDKLVEMGIADPDRLAVLGHSTGGYTTYAVVTYTTRFKAAVAMSGHPDLISLYGQVYPGERTSNHAHEGLATVMFAETTPLNLGGPPWNDLWRYLRNTPLCYLDRIRTPLLIVHGDMDGAPIQQGEEAFTGLYRLGRRAKFVRYWGEGHVISSPVNVRHLWAQIFDWLDTNLGGVAPKPDK